MKVHQILPNIHKPLKKINIIYGINTDVGKTHITQMMINSDFLKSKQIFSIKPIISGFDENDYKNSDNFKLLQRNNNTPSLEEVKEISCYMLKAPLSPDIAAKMENINIDYNKIVSFCENYIKKDGILFIETAGGVCSPISNYHTMADLSKSLSQHSPSNILIVSEYLGAISHTISAMHVMKFDAIIFNKSSQNFMESVISHLLYDVSLYQV